MAKFSKKILINQVKRYDRERIKDMPGRKPFSTREIHAAIQEEKRSNYIRVDELQKLIELYPLCWTPEMNGIIHS